MAASGQRASCAHAGAGVRASAAGTHRHHRQHACRALPARRLAGDDDPGAVSEASTDAPQPRVQRRRGRHAQSLEELRDARRVAQRRGRTHRRLPGEPLRQHQHQGRRGLRVLRLQRVVRGRRGSRRVQEAARRLDRRTRSRSATTARPRRASSCSRRSRTRISAAPIFPDGKANNARLALYTTAMGEVAAAHKVTFVDLYAPSLRAYAASQAAAHDQRRAPERRRQPRSGAASIDTRAVRRRPTLPRSRTSNALRQAVVDKDFYWFNRYRVTDGYSTYGDRAFLTFVRGTPRNVNAEQKAQDAGRRRAAEQLRHHAERAAGARRDDPQSRPPGVGHCVRHGAAEHGSGRLGLRHAADRRREDRTSRRRPPSWTRPRRSRP